MIEGREDYTKADILSILKKSVSKALIDEFLVFTVGEWLARPEEVLPAIQSRFGDHPVVIRSSAANERSADNALAGFYRSELNVNPSDTKGLVQSIGRVIDSYSRGRTRLEGDQVLVQAQAIHIVLSGVVLTREGECDAPYYTINYDDCSGRTDTVTKGLESKVVRIARFSTDSWREPWNKLLPAIQEVEDTFPGLNGAIEFAVDRDGQVHIFQVREVNRRHLTNSTHDDEIASLVRQLQSQFNHYQGQGFHLCGSSTILADMSDWNPAEIIGSRPNMLDFSLYRFLITQSIWNQARVSLGYTDVAPAELMVLLADKPYIDVRVSFNSLTPKGLERSFQERLIDYYLETLSSRPELQDKVEFNIVFTCFDLGFEERRVEFENHGFARSEVDSLKQLLLAFTNQLLADSAATIDQDLYAVGRLKADSVKLDGQACSCALIEEACRLLVSCQRFGAYPFSRLARLAFVGIALLRSLFAEGLITAEFLDGFLNSVDTIVTELGRDFYRLSRGTISLEEFTSRYGHLRPGTYNILAPRYDSMPTMFEGGAEFNDYELSAGKRQPYDPTTVKRIDRALRKAGVDYPATALLDFVHDAIRYREQAKFEFTKSLSSAIELVAQAGAQWGFSREDMAMLDWDTLTLAREAAQPDASRVQHVWAEVIDRNRSAKSLARNIILPPVVINGKDLEFIPDYEPCPNFVTTKAVGGATFFLNHVSSSAPLDLHSRIVLVESADPGYDWVFALRPKGLVTKYGGVASHMAIRCAELGLPAVIGCGETLFNRLVATPRILIDCSSRVIVRV